MSVSVRLTCPRCSAVLQAQGQAGSAIVVQCPKCRQSMTATLPAAGVRPPAKPAAAQAPTDAFADLSTEYSRAPAPVARRPLAMPSQRKPAARNVGLLIAIGGSIAGVVTLGALIGGWMLFSSYSHTVADGGGAPTNGSPVADVSPAGSKSLLSSLFSGPSDSPEEIVDEYFEVLMASEETRQHYGAEQGTPEYEARIERFLVGEERSRDLLRRALLVDGTTDPELRKSAGERYQVFSDQYRFGIPAKSLQENERILLTDPRLANRKWKNLLNRYMSESFFGLSEVEKPGSAQNYRNYVGALAAFARELSQIESEADTRDMETRFAGMIDEIVDYAATYANRSLVVFVQQDHERAAWTLQTFINAYATELRAKGIDSEAFENTMSDYEFAIRQVADRGALSGDAIRAAIAERRAMRKPGYQPTPLVQATQDTPKVAKNDGDAASGQPNESELQTAPAQDVPDPAGAFSGGSRGPRPGDGFGSSRRPPRPSMGPSESRQPMKSAAERKAEAIVRFEGPEHIQIVIHGGRSSVDEIQKFMKSVGIAGFFSEHQNATTIIHAKDPRSPKEIAERIAFGEVTQVDDGGRVISVTLPAGP